MVEQTVQVTDVGSIPIQFTPNGDVMIENIDIDELKVELKNMGFEIFEDLEGPIGVRGNKAVEAYAAHIPVDIRTVANKVQQVADRVAAGGRNFAFYQALPGSGVTLRFAVW
jgi:hypothetical protein